MSKLLIEKVTDTKKIAPGIYIMTVESEYIAGNALPGQFVNVKCCEGLDALLRRPISICSVDRDNNTFEIVFQVRGIGTRYLSFIKTGDEIDLIGPLGTPFHIPVETEKIAVVGGGIGIFPLLFLLMDVKKAHKSAFLGFRNIDNAVLLEQFKNHSAKLFLSTDDGSLGHKGIITDLLDKDLCENSYDYIYTCGPFPMIKKVVEAAQKHGIESQVSLEQRMGCGIGACLVCACKTRNGSEWKYSHVCKDGPVFWGRDVIFDEG